MTKKERTRRFIFLLLLAGFALYFLASCEKEEITPIQEEEIVDTGSWEDEYGNGGTVPNGTGNLENDLVGTQWVLTKYVTQYSTEYPNDTITFVSNTEYTMNGGAVRGYQLSNIPSSTNKELTLNFFFPFGGSHYSAQVGQYFVDDGVMSNVEFEDVQNASLTVQAWFEIL